MDLKEQKVLGERVSKHWYYKSKYNALKRYLHNIPKSKVLDVGAGSAFFSKSMLKDKLSKEVVCVDISYEEEKVETYHGLPVSYKIKTEEVQCDIVLLMDVIEHVNDDIGLLCDYIDKVPKGTYFLITVPAFQFLWSEHDEYLEHKKRYTLSSLQKTVEDSGLKVLRSSYFFGFVFPLVVITRLAGKLLSFKKSVHQSQLTEHSKVVNSLLLALSNAEALIVKYNKFFGISVFCLARKK